LKDINFCEDYIIIIIIIIIIIAAAAAEYKKQVNRHFQMNNSNVAGSQPL
jgi:hypothetical protein